MYANHNMTVSTYPSACGVIACAEKARKFNPFGHAGFDHFGHYKIDPLKIVFDLGRLEQSEKLGGICVESAYASFACLVTQSAGQEAFACAGGSCYEEVLSVADEVTT